MICINFCRSVGKRRKTPNTIKILAEIVVRVLVRTPSDCTIRCKMSVKMIIEIAKERIITHGRDFFQPITDHHTMTGKMGSTQGASTVKTQATKERRRSHIAKWSSN